MQYKCSACFAFFLAFLSTSKAYGQSEDMSWIGDMVAGIIDSIVEISAYRNAKLVEIFPGLETQECPNAADYEPEKEDLKRVLNDHGKWLSEGGMEDTKVPGRAILCNANLEELDMPGIDLGGADLRSANLASAMLSKADFTAANLSGAKLNSADLNDADLILADLSGADLQDADLGNGADLRGANLRNADLISANLRRANLRHAKLNGADLASADLSEVDLSGATVRDARFLGIVLTDANYSPTSAPAKGYLTGISGLATVQFDPGENSGLVLLRAALQEAGLRQLEREATFALERGQTRHVLDRWPQDVGAGIEGALRLVFFEWTTGYGLYYQRPIALLVVLIVAFAAVYLVPVSRLIDADTGESGIYRIWPKDRIEREGDSFTACDNVEVEPFVTRGPAVIGYAIYFSALSAFHIGWRELNVGSWLMRLQAREYNLRPKGWVRVVSGTQSLISVYLLAMWALTYFGRPFQ